jgi:hypothetical protein
LMSLLRARIDKIPDMANTGSRIVPHAFLFMIVMFCYQI